MVRSPHAGIKKISHLSTTAQQTMGIFLRTNFETRTKIALPLLVLYHLDFASFPNLQATILAALEKFRTKCK